DEATRRQLQRGQRVTELMKQKQYSPLSVAEMALSLYAVNEGYLDPVEVSRVTAYEAALHDYARANHQDLLDRINETGDWNDEIEAGLKQVCDGFSQKGAY
ncbi:MAG TPA: F0F1 ATP synthase subunit alpha, partial [Woeseiaceae bacterium]|nr:F0F1 ATP synthase subunit alpha [Woeseiaceae bacterium]